jgi:hypothetical protein
VFGIVWLFTACFSRWFNRKQKEKAKKSAEDENLECTEHVIHGAIDIPILWTSSLSMMFAADVSILKVHLVGIILMCAGVAVPVVLFFAGAVVCSSIGWVYQQTPMHKRWLDEQRAAREANMLAMDAEDDLYAANTFPDHGDDDDMIVQYPADQYSIDLDAYMNHVITDSASTFV